MLASGQSEKTIVARLRVRGPGLDPAMARLRLDSLLQSVRLRPASLPPSAILVIKQVRDPLPGHLSLHQSGLVRPPQRWERAVSELLEQLARRAARPALGPVDELATEAVVFLDRSELLACLASDWCRFGVLNRWWWRGMFKDQDKAQAIVRLWIEASAYAPAALAQLAKRGEAVAFLRTLRETDTRLLFDSIIRSFALREIAKALDALREASNSATTYDSDESRVARATPQSGPKASSPYARTRPPWSKVAPEAAGGGLAAEAECLLGTALMLHRAPAPARSSEFARALLAWRLAVARTRPAHAAHPVETKTANTRSGAEKEPPKSATTAHTLKRLAFADFKVESLSDDGNKSPGAKPVAAAAQAYPIGLSMDAADGLEGTPREAHMMGPRESAFNAQESEETHCETEFGGLFYLINLALFLGLYGDFSAPAETAPPLSLWDFVALVARQLVGEELESDAMWPLLAGFAGRTGGQAPGHDFTAPESWRILADWLLPFAGKSSWEWEARDGRLRVCHAKGFCVLDVELASNEPAPQVLRRELEEYAGAAEFELLPGQFSEEQETNSLSRWLNWLMPYVRVRLEQALGPLSEGEWPRVLCEQHARIICTATHLDIFMSLAQLPVAVRLSGLDRDPGWVPSAGKFIAFHFE